MIRSFRDKDVEAVFLGRSVPRFRTIERQLQRRLHYLDAATCLEDLAGLPSNRFERLRGGRKEQYSIRVDQQWRLCFRWTKHGAEDVEVVDYH